MAGRQPRIGHQLGCFHPTSPDEHPTLHQLAVLEPEAFLGCSGDRRVGADLDPKVRKDSAGLVDQLGGGAGQDGGARLDKPHSGPVRRQAVPAGFCGQHLGQLPGQFDPGGAAAADHHRRQTVLPLWVGGGRGGRERCHDRCPHPLGVARRVQRQRALGQAGDSEVVGPASERQHQPPPADRPNLGEQPSAGQVETTDLGPDETDSPG